MMRVVVHLTVMPKMMSLCVMLLAVVMFACTSRRTLTALIYRYNVPLLKALLHHYSVSRLTAERKQRLAKVRAHRYRIPMPFQRLKLERSGDGDPENRSSTCQDVSVSNNGTVATQMTRTRPSKSCLNARPGDADVSILDWLQRDLRDTKSRASVTNNVGTQTWTALTKMNLNAGDGGLQSAGHGDFDTDTSTSTNQAVSVNTSHNCSKQPSRSPMKVLTSKVSSLKRRKSLHARRLTRTEQDCHRHALVV